MEKPSKFSLDSVTRLSFFIYLFELYEHVGEDHTIKLHTWGVLCEYLLHCQCRTTLEILSTVTEAAIVRILHRMRVSLLVYINIL